MTNGIDKVKFSKDVSSLFSGDLMEEERAEIADINNYLNSISKEPFDQNRKLLHLHICKFTHEALGKNEQCDLDNTPREKPKLINSDSLCL